MPVRPPPGRSGRIWLADRLNRARRASELLDQKLRALLAEERRLVAEAEIAASEWDRSARAAQRWAVRAAMLGGQRQLQLVQVHTRRQARVDVHWRSRMGVTYPAEVTVEKGEAGPSALGGTGALDLAAAAHEEALEAGVRHAAAKRALELLRAEVRVTRRRQRVLDRRWVPLLTSTLERLDAALEELERDGLVRSRWLQQRAANARREASGR